MNDEPSGKTPQNRPTFAAQVGASAARKLKARRRSNSGVWLGLGMMGSYNGLISLSQAVDASHTGNAATQDCGACHSTSPPCARARPRQLSPRLGGATPPRSTGQRRAASTSASTAVVALLVGASHAEAKPGRSGCAESGAAGHPAAGSPIRSSVEPWQR